MLFDGSSTDGERRRPPPLVSDPVLSGTGGARGLLGSATGSLFAPLPPWPFGSLKPHHHQLLVIDPPWDFDLYSAAGEEKSAAAHYECMPIEAIEALPVGELADPNCLCLLWVTAPRLPEGLRALKAWGLEYKSFIHWTKVHASGKPAMGCGYRVRTMGELVLVATKGSPRHEPLPGNFTGTRREHSRKPDEFYALVERSCRSLKRRADLFARQSRPGWSGWGREQTKFDPLETT